MLTQANIPFYFFIVASHYWHVSSLISSFSILSCPYFFPFWLIGSDSLAPFSQWLMYVYMCVRCLWYGACLSFSPYLCVARTAALFSPISAKMGSASWQNSMNSLKKQRPEAATGEEPQITATLFLSHTPRIRLLPTHSVCAAEKRF